LLNYESKIANEKEFLKRVISTVQQQSNKKVCVEKPEAVKNNYFTLIRYIAYNGNYWFKILIFRNKLIFCYIL